MSGTLVVTGGSRGIGAAVVRRAALDGWSVAFSFVDAGEAAEAVVEAVAAGGGQALAVRADVRDDDAVANLFDEAAAAFGPVTGVVANAGITGGFARVETVDSAAALDVLDVNVVGVLRCAREAVRRMSTRHGGPGGSFVAVTSKAARLGGPGEWVHYAASKGAVETVVAGLAKEVGGEGIRVNAVAPGLIVTDLHATSGEPGRLERIAPTVPMGRAGTPYEVAEAVVWLLSPAASYVTGAVLDVAGGR